jgi:hypothetical protein
MAAQASGGLARNGILVVLETTTTHCSERMRNTSLSTLSGNWPEVFFYSLAAAILGRLPDGAKYLLLYSKCVRVVA